MALDLTKPSMLDINWATSLGYIRENFRAIVQDAIDFANGIKERGRSVKAGEWYPAPTFNAGNYTSDVGTWVVASGNVLKNTYMMLGLSMWLQVTINASTITGAPAELRILLPAGMIGTSRVDFLCSVKDGSGVEQVCVALVNATGTQVAISRLVGGTFTAGAGNVVVRVSTPPLDVH